MSSTAAVALSAALMVGRTGVIGSMRGSPSWLPPPSCGALERGGAGGRGELQRVARRGAFVTVDAYRDEDERRRMDAWNLTAKTIMHVDEWKAFFDECGYTGDYYWFMP